MLTDFINILLVSYYVISYDNHYIFMIVFYGLVLL